jgi:UMF1 family MFS transporter
MTDSTSRAGAPDGGANNRVAKNGVGGVWAPAGISWALFEFARNPFYMLIVTYVFPPYFQTFVIGDAVRGQAEVAATTGWAGVIAALTAPVLGSMMDRGGPRKPLMAVFVAMLAITGVALWWALPGTRDADGVFHPPTAGLGAAGTMAFLVMAYVGYSYSEMMHNAMLRSSGRPQSLSQISGAGIGLGQLAAALCLTGVVVIAISAPQLGGEEGGYALQRGVGPFLAVWLLVFVIPFFLFTPDGHPAGGSWKTAFRDTFSTNGKFDPVGRAIGIFGYLRGLFRSYPEAMKYLLACLIFKDGITALLAIGGVYSSGVLGWGIAEAGLYGIWASIFGAIGGLWLAGMLDRTMGPRRAIMLQLGVLCLAFVFALGITQDSILFGLIPAGQVIHGAGVFDTLADVTYLGTIAVVAALAAANIAASRYMIVQVAPPQRLSEFFGLFAMSSTATVWIGPVLVNVFTNASNDQRIGFSPVLLLLGVGLLLMMTLKKTTGGKPSASGAAAPPAH